MPFATVEPELDRGAECATVIAELDANCRHSQSGARTIILHVLVTRMPSRNVRAKFSQPPKAGFSGGRAGGTPEAISVVGGFANRVPGEKQSA